MEVVHYFCAKLGFNTKVVRQKSEEGEVSAVAGRVEDELLPLWDGPNHRHVSVM